MKIKIKIKKGPKAALLPRYANPGDAGVDLRATSKTLIAKEGEVEYIEYGTDLYIAIPEGHVGLLFPRSSISGKDLLMSNSVGVIDSSYRGELKVRFKVKPGYFGLWQEPDGEIVYCETAENWDRGWGLEFAQYKVGDKIAQLLVMPYPEIEWEEVEKLPSTERGSSGFGSSGA